MLTALSSVVRTARVLAIGTDGTVQLDLDESDSEAGNWARVAVPYAMSVGQESLALADADGQWFVIGIINASPAIRRLTTSAGVSAEVIGPLGEEKVRVLSPHGELLFEHDPLAGLTRLSMPAGDLELLQPQGRITLAAAELRLVAGEIDLHAARTVRIAVPGAEPESGTTLVADARHLACRSGNLQVTAAQGDVAIDDARASGGRWSLELGTLATAVDLLETTARSVVEKAQNVYRQVAELLQVQAGRLRHHVTGSYHLKCEDAYIKTEKDFKVQGEQIHLG